MLLNSKPHIDRHEAEVNMIKVTSQKHFMSTKTRQQLFYDMLKIFYVFPANLDHYNQ